MDSLRKSHPPKFPLPEGNLEKFIDFQQVTFPGKAGEEVENQ
jgi:hypothetical protein